MTVALDVGADNLTMLDVSRVPIWPPTSTHDQTHFEPSAEKDELRLSLPLSVVGRRDTPTQLFYPSYLMLSSPSWCSPERLFTSSTSRCLRPHSRARIIPGAEPQITMPDGIATARSGVFVASWYM